MNRRVYLINEGPEGYTEQQVTMMELKRGDLFRMDEETGEPVLHGDSTRMRAVSNPYLNGNGDPSIISAPA